MKDFMPGKKCVGNGKESECSGFVTEEAIFDYKHNGYEIVDMLGKPYHEGMKVIANFVENEELELGKQIITGIIKPQINYKGKMIQAAQITVSQNL